MEIADYFNRERWEVDLGPRCIYLGNINVIYAIGKYMNLSLYLKKRVMIHISLSNKYVILK